MTEKNIFVSYSRRDGRLVKPVVDLLRVTEAFVFLDADSLRHGKRWRDQIDAAIAGASTLVLFWCHHSHQSAEVRVEIASAIASRKDILPVLLDDTPLGAELSEFHYIDLRNVVDHHGVRRRREAVRRAGGALHSAILPALALLTLAGAIWLAFKYLSPTVLWAIAATLLVLGLAFGAWAVWDARSRRHDAGDAEALHRQRMHERAGPPPDPEQDQQRAAPEGFDAQRATYRAVSLISGALRVASAAKPGDA